MAVPGATFTMGRRGAAAAGARVMDDPNLTFIEGKRMPKNDHIRHSLLLHLARFEAQAGAECEKVTIRCAYTER